MSPLEIVLLTLLASIFFLTIIAAVGFNIYTTIQIRKEVPKFLAEFRSGIQSSSSSMAKLQQDMRLILAEHQKEMGEQIGQINGEGIRIAAEKLNKLIPRMERATLAFGELVLAHDPDVKSDAKSLGADQFANDAIPGESFISESETARLDRESLQAEQEETTLPS